MSDAAFKARYNWLLMRKGHRDSSLGLWGPLIPRLWKDCTSCCAVWVRAKMFTHSDYMWESQSPTALLKNMPLRTRVSPLYLRFTEPPYDPKLGVNNLPIQAIQKVSPPNHSNQNYLLGLHRKFRGPVSLPSTQSLNIFWYVTRRLTVRNPQPGYSPLLSEMERCTSDVFYRSCTENRTQTHGRCRW